MTTTTNLHALRAGLQAALRAGRQSPGLQSSCPGGWCRRCCCGFPCWARFVSSFSWSWWTKLSTTPTKAQVCCARTAADARCETGVSRFACDKLLSLCVVCRHNRRVI
ncbi:unnamed protein product [Ectocarpus fasciculatus]